MRARARCKDNHIYIITPPCVLWCSTAHRCCMSSQSPPPENPWNFAYIHRERTSVWTDDNKARLIKLIASNSLAIPLRELEYRVFELTLLVPDLAKRLHTLQPTTLATLLTDTTAVASCVIALRHVLPTANIGAMVARQPDILLQVRGCQCGCSYQSVFRVGRARACVQRYPPQGPARCGIGRHVAGSGATVRHGPCMH